MEANTVAISDERVAQAVHEILASADLAQTTPKLVIQQLEERLGVSVADRKALVKQAIADFAAKVAQQAQPQEVQTTQEDGTSDAENGNGKAAAEADEDGSAESDESSDGEEEGEDAGEGEEGEEEAEDGGKSSKKRKRGTGGFAAELQLSTELSEFMNSITSTRTAVVKAMWDYIKQHNLQDPSDRRKIRCDDTLQRIFKRKSLTMFNMNKFLTPLMKAVHELPDAKVEEEAAAPKRPKSKSKAAASAAPEEGKKKQRVKKEKAPPNNGFNKPLRLSEPLSNLLGEAELSRPQIVKHMWNYIKENSLQDPSDRRNIICDDRLRDVFGVNKFTSFSLNKLLTKHVSPL